MSALKTLCEVEVKSPAEQKPLVEDGLVKSMDEETRNLMECMAGYPTESGSYRERSFEEKLRDACNLIQEAVMQKAMEGIEDGGKELNWSGDKSPYSAGRAVIRKAVFPDQFKTIVPSVRKALEGFLE